MRITGGRTKGRVLAGPRSRLIRPTADRVREALFSILGQDLSGYHVLDLFSGTGSLGLESLSRGAAHAVFIDNLRESIELIIRNIEQCGYRYRASVLKRDLTKGIPWEHAFLRKTPDMIFLDPPYSMDVTPLMAEIGAVQRLAQAVRVIFETRKTTDLPPSFARFERVRDRVYGDTRISVYERRD